MVRSTDSAWQYGTAIGGDRLRIECKLCGKKLLGGGITRLKEHLAHVRGETKGCPSVPREVKENIRASLKAAKGKKKAEADRDREMYDRIRRGDPEFTSPVPEDDEDEDEDEQMARVMRESAREAQQRRDQEEADYRFRSRLRGPSMPAPGGGSSHMPHVFDVDEDIDQTAGLRRSASVRDTRPSTTGRTTGRTTGPMDPFMYRTESSKQTKLSAMSLKKLGKKLGKSIAKFFIYNHIPTQVAESPYFKSMIDTSAEVGPGVKKPSAYEISGPLLQDEYDEIGAYVKSFEEVWDERGCTIMCDGWTGPTKKSLINFLIYSDAGTVFLKSVDASRHAKTSDYLFQLMDKVVEEVGEQRVVQVVTDNAANYKAAGIKLMLKRRHLYWTPCAAHCLDLILEDLGKRSKAQATIEKGRMITSFLYNSDKLVNLMRDFTKNELLRPAITRFATQFLALQSLARYRRELKTMVASEQWSKYEAELPRAKRLACTEIAELIYSTQFWADVDHLIAVTTPLVQVLRLVDGDEKPTMGYVYESMDKAKLAIKTKCPTKYKRYWAIIDKRWDAQFHQYLHAAAHYLNPVFQYTRRFELSDTDEVYTGLLNVIQRMLPELADQGQAIRDIDMFRKRHGSFGTPLAQSQIRHDKPADWWMHYGGDGPILRRVAMRVLSQTCSSSNCERNWSTFSLIHSKSRNRLTMERLEKLVYCHYNMRLRVRNMQRTNRDSEYFDPIQLDYIFEEDDPLNQWIEEREEPVLDTESTEWLDNAERVAEQQASQPLRRKRRLNRHSVVGSDDETQPGSDDGSGGDDGGGDVGTSGGGEDVGPSDSYRGIAAWDDDSTPLTVFDTPTFRRGGIEGRGASESYQTPPPQGPQDDMGYMTSSFGGFSLQNTEDSATSNPYPVPYDFVGQIFGGPSFTYYTEPYSLLQPQFQGGTYDHGYQYGQHYRQRPETSRTDDDDHEGQEPPRNSMWL